VLLKPRKSRWSAISDDSDLFIWQPIVQIWYFMMKLYEIDNHRAGNNHGYAGMDLVG
jgi:hypothetical protein